MALDPVCKMELEKKDASATVDYEEKTYYFCSPACKADFEKEPDKYAVKGE